MAGAQVRTLPPMRVRAMLLLVAAALAVGACGGGSSDTSAVRDALKQYVDDLQSGDTAGACSVLASGVKQQLGGTQCPQRLKALLALVPSATLKQVLSRIKPDQAKVTVRGSTATADVGGRTPIPFVKQNQEWLISSGGVSLSGK